MYNQEFVRKHNLKNDAVYRRAGGKVNYPKEQEVKLETFW